jgi:hypothetical protein
LFTRFFCSKDAGILSSVIIALKNNVIRTLPAENAEPQDVWLAFLLRLSEAWAKASYFSVSRFGLKGCAPNVPEGVYYEQKN